MSPAPPCTILLISGSLRGGSVNGSVLRTARAIAAPGQEIKLYERMGDLPHFSPDADREPLPEAVADLRAQLAASDAVLFSTPEYAGALPGSFKNLLDWTVGGGIQEKSVGWINASMGGAQGTYEQLRAVLSYTDTDIVPGACALVPVPRSAIGADGLITDRAIRSGIAKVLTALEGRVAARRTAATSEAGVHLGHVPFGSGPTRVLVLNDWLCDTSTWDDARKYLDVARFAFVFADLRGYGRSRSREGAFTLVEAAADVVALADALGWQRFALVGHSMSALVVLHLAQHHAERVERAVVITPPPPRGFGANEAQLAASRALAMGDDATRLESLAARSGGRLSNGWTAYKASRWRTTAEPAAAAGYVAMFARDGLRDPAAPITAPVLCITGEQDAPPMRREAMLRELGPICDQLVVTPLAECGHYPMQEMPPRTVALLERFLSGRDVTAPTG